VLEIASANNFFTVMLFYFFLFLYCMGIVQLSRLSIVQNIVFHTLCIVHFKMPVSNLFFKAFETEQLVEC